MASTTAVLKALISGWKEMAFSERARLVKTLLDSGEYSKSDLAEALQISGPNVSYHYKLNWLKPSELDRLDKGSLRIDDAISMARTRYNAAKAGAEMEADRKPAPPPEPPPEPEKPPKLEEADRVDEVRTETDDQIVIDLKSARITTKEELIDYCKVNLDVWEVESFTIKKSEVTMKPAATTEYMETKDGRQVPAWVRFDKEPVTVQMFHLKAIFRRKASTLVSIRKVLDNWIEEAKIYVPQYTPFSRPLSMSGNMLEIAPVDIHMGKLGWHEETGWEDCDSDLTERAFNDSIEHLLAGAMPYQPERILFVIGNDLLNADNKALLTTRGTPQGGSTDTRFQKVFDRTFRMKVRAIDRLLTVAPVRVLIVPGNHDELSCWFLGRMLQLQYQGLPASQLTIDNTPTMRKYCKWGKVGLMFTHGDKAKRKELSRLFPAERRQMWGDTLFNEVHTGHLHSEQMAEFPGVKVRVLTSLTSPDEWHSSSGFVGNQRCAQSFLWNKDAGLQSINFFTVPSEPYIPDVEREVA